MKRNSGQALVLVLLSLSVVLTLVLYILSRSITDIAISSREEESVRAFSAAEAGIERALVVGSSIGNTAIGDATFSTTVANVSEGTYTFNYPINLVSNDSATLWFVSHDIDGNLICDGSHPCFTGNTLKICWGEAGTAASLATTPAVEVSLVYDTGTVARWAIDPNSGRLATNSFASPDAGTCQVDGETYEFNKTLTLPAGSLKFVNARMFYNSDKSHKIGFDVNFAGNSTLPSQGIMASSTGTSGEANRRIEVFQSYAQAPSVFENVIFSSFGITK